MFKILESASPESPMSSLSLRRPAGLALTYGALNFSFGSWAWPSRPTPVPSSTGLDEHSNKLQKIKSSGALLSTSTILPPSAKVVIGSLEEGRRNASDRAVESGSFSSKENRSSNENTMHHQAHTSLFEQRQAVVAALGPEAFQSPLEKAEISQLVRTRLTMSSKAGYMHDRIITPSMVSCLFLVEFLFFSVRCWSHSRVNYFIDGITLRSDEVVVVSRGSRDNLEQWWILARNNFDFNASDDAISRIISRGPSVTERQALLSVQLH